MENSVVPYDKNFQTLFRLAFEELGETGAVVSKITLGRLVHNANIITSRNNEDVEIIPHGTGQVIVKTNPTSNMGVATKQYVDNATNVHNHLASAITDFNTATDARIQLQSGVSNGIASLDGGGKVPVNQLPFSGEIYLGTWNANTNTPTITSGVGSAGEYYKVGTAGNTIIDGTNGWQVGDSIAFSGVAWQRVPTSNAVSSVAGKVGVITLTAADITSGTFDDARIPSSSVIQHEAALNIENMLGAPTGDVVGTSDSQILTGKTIDATTNTLSNIGDAHLIAGINAAKLADGTVSNTELQFINSVTSNVQDQLDAKSEVGHVHSAADLTSGLIPNARVPASAVLQHESAINLMNLTASPQSLPVGINDFQTITNKTVNADLNFISNIGNEEIKAGISAEKIGDGSVSNTEFGYLADLTGPIQFQLSGKAANTHTHATNEISDFVSKVPIIKFDGVGAPTANDDSTGGYTVGSRWLDTTNDEEYVCMHNDVGGAIWEHTTGSGGGGGGDLIVRDEGSDVAGGPFTALNFEGGGVTVTNEGNNTAKVSISVPKLKTDASSAPTETDDINSGYLVGSKWLDVQNGKVYICMDNTSTLAKWNEILTDKSTGEQIIVTTVSTTDNIPSNLVSVATTNDLSYFIELSIISRRTDAPFEAGAYSIKSLYRNDAGTLTKVVDDILEMEDKLSWRVTSTTNGANILITCEGHVGSDITWKSVCKVLSV